MTRDQRNRPRPRQRDRRPDHFRCTHCHYDVPADAPGTAHRNHCPTCLWSRHLDDVPGDRAADCGSSMEPIAITVRGDGEWVLVHRCSGCGRSGSGPAGRRAGAVGVGCAGRASRGTSERAS